MASIVGMLVIEAYLVQRCWDCQAVIGPIVKIFM